MSKAPILLLLEENETSAVAVALRGRGYDVIHARSAEDALARGRATALAALIVPHSHSEGGGESTLVDALTLEIGVLPPLFHLDEAARQGDERAVASLVERIDDLTAGAVSSLEGRVAEVPPVSFAIPETSILEVVTILVAEKKTGVLFVRTPSLLGEAYFVEGDVVDVAYGRHEGDKAFCRMLDVKVGALVFEPRRVETVPLHPLVGAELVQRLEAWSSRVRGLRGTLIARAEATWNVLDASSLREPNPTSRAVLAALRTPLTLNALLDKVADLDPDVLEAVIALEQSGAIGVTSPLLGQVSLGTAEEMVELRARLATIHAPGFEGPLRLVLAGAPIRLGVAAQALAAFEESIDAGEGSRRGALPGNLASLRLGEGHELTVVGLPLMPAYAPLWPLVLAGAIAVVRLDEAAHELLRALCDASAIPLLDAKALVEGYDDADARKVARLVSAAIEASAKAPGSNG